MKALREETRAAQTAAGVRTLSVAHFLGFLDRRAAPVPTARPPRAAA